MSTIKSILTMAAWSVAFGAGITIGTGVATTILDNGLEDWVAEKTNALFKK